MSIPSIVALSPWQVLKVEEEKDLENFPSIVLEYVPDAVFGGECLILTDGRKQIFHQLGVWVGGQHFY